MEGFLRAFFLHLYIHQEKTVHVAQKLKRPPYIQWIGNNAFYHASFVPIYYRCNCQKLFRSIVLNYLYHSSLNSFNHTFCSSFWLPCIAINIALLYITINNDRSEFGCAKTSSVEDLMTFDGPILKATVCTRKISKTSGVLCIVKQEMNQLFRCFKARIRYFFLRSDRERYCKLARKHIERRSQWRFSNSAIGWGLLGSSTSSATSFEMGPVVRKWRTSKNGLLWIVL